MRPGGLVLDLGCGFGAIADAVTEAGFVYVGADVDPVGIRAIGERGHEAHLLDLQGVDVADRIVEIADRRQVAVLTLLDVIEHIPDTTALLDALLDASGRMAYPSLVVSVPNVAHIDVAAKLALGSVGYLRLRATRSDAYPVLQRATPNRARQSARLGSGR